MPQDVRKRRDFLNDQLSRCNRLRGDIARKEDQLRQKSAINKGVAVVPIKRPVCPGLEFTRASRPSSRKKMDPDFEHIPDDEVEDGGVRWRPAPCLSARGYRRHLTM